jgi:cytochrome c553
MRKTLSPKFTALLATLASATLLNLLAVPAVLAQDAKAGDAKAGEGKAAMCIGCHGIHGYQASFPEIHKVPMISGQNAKYIVNALVGYKSGDRKHPTMRGIADSLSDQDMADLAAFYTSNKLAAAGKSGASEPSAKVAELLKKGACASCHGADFNKPIDAGYPKVAGQHADYLAVALKAYKTEGNAQVGRSNGVMAGVAKQFSNAELRELSAYIGKLPGELQTVPQSKFRN